MEQSSNFKTKIHAATTILKFCQLGQALQNDHLYGETWMALVNTLEQHNQAVYTTQDHQKKYVETLETLIFTLWKEIASKTDANSAEQLKDFINAHSLALLHTIIEYLRKNLKVPKYSEMYDDRELLLQETEALFKHNEKLEAKLQDLKAVITAIRNTIKANEQVHVSFGVYDSLNSLAEASVREYRLLDCLKIQRTSFMPSFDD